LTVIHKARYLMENFFSKLKQYRAIATRYDKAPRNLLAAIRLALLPFGSIEDRL
jgi:transposase